jgi:hypothetical protein
MADDSNKQDSGPNRQSRREADQAASTQQRKQGKGSGTPGRDDQSDMKARRSSRHGEDRADARDIDSRQGARSEALLRGDEASDIDQPDRNH